MHGHIDPCFSTPSYPMTPLFNNSQPIFDNLLQNNPLFDNMSKCSIKKKKFVQSVSKFVFALKIDQIWSDSHCLIHFLWGHLIEWPPFSEKNLSLKDPYFWAAVQAPLSLKKMSAPQVSNLHLNKYINIWDALLHLNLHLKESMIFEGCLK